MSLLKSLDIVIRGIMAFSFSVVSRPLRGRLLPVTLLVMRCRSIAQKVCTAVSSIYFLKRAR